MAVGKNLTWKKKGKGKQCHLPYNIEAIGKNIKWGKGEGVRTFRGRKSKLKIWEWGRISRELFTTLNKYLCLSLPRHLRDGSELKPVPVIVLLGGLIAHSPTT